ncbi:hypothetical protein [Pseudoxanthomonas sp.]|uniref:hypothetical protein n=1 Tax=Pseudoxanthomonas sp. TaxID=1871049 RepID=UPI00258CD65D|nr:hypothetical protein [Pseudoxanthomonas sp.]MCR6686614.1 hypothetical protein [Pseudoxanthomonas sp.]
MNTRSIHRWPMTRWLPAALLALGLGGGALALPVRAEAADVQVRVLVDVADLIFRSGRPYYYDRGYYQPVVIEYDRWHRPVYYRYAPRPVVVHAPPPRYYAPPPPRHYAPPPHYRAGYRYSDRRDWRDDRGRNDWRHDRGRGHDDHRGRGRGHGRD